MRGPIRTGLSFALLWMSAFAAGAQQVTLPLAQFEELRERANPAPDEDLAPPAPFALSTAEILIGASAESARVVQTLDLTIYADGWQKIPLGEAGSFIAARFGDLEGRVNVDGQGWALQARGRGRHSVTLESVVPVTRDETATRPTWRLGLRVPPAAVVRGRLAVPAGVEEAEMAGAGLLGKEGEVWSFVAAPTAEPVRFELRGRRTLPERAQLPLRFEATSATAAVLSRTRLRVHGWIEARVAQGSLPELRVPLPEGFKVVSVSGPTAGWTLDQGTLVVTPLEPVETALAIQIELTAEPRSAFASPLLAPAGSRRTLFLTKAAIQGDGLLELTDAGAVRTAAASEAAALPGAVTGVQARLLAVTDPARPPRWQAEWAERTEVLAAQIDRLVVDVAIGEAGRASYQVWAEIRNRGTQQLVVMPPPGFELVSGSRDGEPVSPGAAGTSGLAVPLLTREEAQVVHLAGLLPLALPESGRDFELPLPVLSAPAARIEVRLILPPGRSYSLADATRAGGVAAPPSAVDRAARKNAALSSNAIAKQVLTGPGGSGAAAPELFPRPPGFAEITAVWSALSAPPAPLAIRLKSDKEVSEWF